MKKLNNKGMTIVEILITFVIISSITISLYASISNLKNKEEISSYKTSITTYKNLLTREIQNDLIMKKVKHVVIRNNHDATIQFRTGEDKDLKINTSSLRIPKNPKLCKTDSNIDISNQESIQYGTENYPLPALGNEKVQIDSSCENLNKLYISDSSIEIKNSRILVIYIELFHPDLGSKYSINIIAPINYT